MVTAVTFIERIVALHGITLQMAEQNDELSICRVAVAQGTASLDVDRLAIFRPDDDPDYMRGTWGTDRDGSLTDESAFRAPIADREMIARSLSRRDLVAVEEPVTLLWCHQPVGIGWNAMVAMWHGKEVLGWIFADNLINRRPFTDEDREILKLLAASIGQMLRRVRAETSLRKMNQELEQRIAKRTEALKKANERLEVLSRTDALTGLSNRRALDEWFPRELGRARRMTSSICLLALDVDHFKPYNDALGHHAGDQCLVILAELIQSVCRRSTDLAVR
ncbi:MAG: diguanylate cyclase, partial [Natronospirillum sp.]